MPYEEEVTSVVNLSRVPPRTTVFEEFVSPLPNDKGAWYEIEAVPAEFILPCASIDSIGIRVVDP